MNGFQPTAPRGMGQIVGEHTGICTIARMCWVTVADSGLPLAPSLTILEGWAPGE